MPKTQQTPSSVLLSLLEEYQLTPFSLSKKISLSYSAVRQLVIGKVKVTVSTALRLAKFFGQTPEYWLDLQQSAELDEAQKDKELMEIIKGITRAKKPASEAKVQVKAKTNKTKAKAPKSKSAAGGGKAKKLR